MSKQINLEKAVHHGHGDAGEGQQERAPAAAQPAGESETIGTQAVLRRARRARRHSGDAIRTKWRLASMLVTAALLAAFQPAAIRPALAATPAKTPTPPAPANAPLAPCTSTAVAEPATITLGKSTLIRLPAPVVRLVVGGLGTGHAGKPVEMEVKDLKDMRDLAKPIGSQRTAAKTGVADVDVMLLSPTELYLLGKRVGSMNVVLQDRADKCTIMDVIVTVDAGSLQAKLAQLMPDEKNIKVSAADDTLILAGEVNDATKVERAMALASAYVSEKRLVNMMRTRAASQVMLEVKVAEVSKTLLDQLGARFNSLSSGAGGSGRWTYSLLSEFLTPGTGLVQALKLGKGDFIINGEKDDGIVRVLAEPNIMAISGQQASFLSGGKIFIPVARDSGSGGVTITLEEKEFGVGVKFTPTVLDGDRINLKVASEVSELSQTGSPFTTIGGVTAVLPSFTTRKADTTVQLRDGQSFAIAGLIKNNLTESVKRFPGLGEVPILGALFRSSEFQRDMTELLFIITPRLVKPLPMAGTPLPTDNFKEPTRSEFLFEGKLEGTGEMPGSKKRTPAPVSDAGGAPVALPAPEAPKALPAPAEALAKPEPKPVAKPEPEPVARPEPEPVAMPEPVVDSPATEPQLVAIDLPAEPQSVAGDTAPPPVFDASFYVTDDDAYVDMADTRGETP